MQTSPPSRPHVVRGARRSGVTLAATLAIVILATQALPVGSGQSKHPKSYPAPAAKLFDQSEVQVIELTMSPPDWEKLKANYAENAYYPADLKWKSHTVPTVGVRSRGSGSRSGQKPSLGVDINRYVDQTLLKLESFVLANALQDQSMLHQRLGMRFFEKMNVPAPRVVHAKVYVNGDYAGLYELIETLDKVMLPHLFGEAVDGKKENDGYLYEYRWKDFYHWEYPGPDLALYADRFEPQTHKSAAPADLYGPLEEMIRAVNTLSDRDFERTAGEYFDLTQLAAFLAVENFIADDDGFLGSWGVNNIYLYTFESTTRSALIPWDKDHAFQSPTYDVMQNVDRNVLSSRALRIPSVYRVYLDTLKACATMAMQPDKKPKEGEIPVGWLEAELRQEIEQIQAAAYADRAKPYSDKEFDDAIALMVEFAKTRAPFVLNAVNNVPAARATARR